MRLLVINPNTTVAMTEHVVEQLRQYLPAGTTFLPKTARIGEPVIATAHAFESAAHGALGMLRDVQSAQLQFDAVVLACFGDPGLEALRRATAVPVIGLAHACMQVAEQAGEPYAIVSAGHAWGPILTARMKSWGASGLFRGVQLLEGTGLGVWQDRDAAALAVAQAIDITRRGGASITILGGTPLAGYRGVLARQHLARDKVLDCVESAARVALATGLFDEHEDKPGEE